MLLRHRRVVLCPHGFTLLTRHGIGPLRVSGLTRLLRHAVHRAAARKLRRTRYAVPWLPRHAVRLAIALRRLAATRPLAIRRARHLSWCEAVSRHALLLTLRRTAAGSLSARAARSTCHGRTCHGTGHLPWRMRAHDPNVRDRTIPAERLRTEARRHRRMNDRLARARHASVAALREALRQPVMKRRGDARIARTDDRPRHHVRRRTIRGVARAGPEALPDGRDARRARIEAGVAPLRGIGAMREAVGRLSVDERRRWHRGHGARRAIVDVRVVDVVMDIHAVVDDDRVVHALVIARAPVMVAAPVRMPRLAGPEREPRQTCRRRTADREIHAPVAAAAIAIADKGDEGRRIDGRLADGGLSRHPGP